MMIRLLVGFVFAPACVASTRAADIIVHPGPPGVGGRGPS
jgi:hypothetical protein